MRKNKNSGQKTIDGKKVKKTREEKGWSRLRLATESNVSYSMLWDIENFDSDTRVSNLINICIALDKPLQEMLLPTAVSVA